MNPFEKSILRSLAEEVAVIADLPAHQTKIDMWKQLNGLKRVRPLVWINEIPWHEMNYNAELTLRTETPLYRQVEQMLRQTIYQWKYLPVDMVVEPVFYSSLVIRDTGFGIEEDIDFIKQDENSTIISREFHSQIQSEKDLEKIKIPRLTLDLVATESNFQQLQSAFGDILPVQKCGLVHQWFAPWDWLIRWWGVEAAMLDLVMRPELVHLGIERLVNAHLARLDQLEALNALAVTPGNYRVGSGALGYTDELPPPDFDPNHVHPKDQWGCCAAQIFSDVSPEMHAEFALQYEIKWLERFGLNYYGCCEPLHHKIGILKSVPRLRKISMSPWVKVDQAVKNIQNRYVYSHKPNPAVLAAPKWQPEQARRELEAVLDKTRDCVVEIIMKDISTVQYQPQRLWDWARIAMEVVQKYE